MSAKDELPRPWLQDDEETERQAITLLVGGAFDEEIRADHHGHGRAAGEVRRAAIRRNFIRIMGRDCGEVVSKTFWEAYGARANQLGIR